MKNKIDYLTYLKLLGGVFLTTPLQVAYWSYEFSIVDSIIITIIMYLIASILGILLLNYLETGSTFKFIKL